MKTALLVIDLQHDFIEGKLEVKGIKEKLDKLRNFIWKCRKKGVKVIYTKHLFDPIDNPIEAEKFPGKSYLQEGTQGSEVHNIIIPEKEDIIIKKRRYDAFFGTNLEKVLRSKGIERVIIIGTMTNVCCDSTARSAMYRDFNVLFSSDLTFTSNLEVHENTLKTIQSHFGKVMTSKEILQLY